MIPIKVELENFLSYRKKAVLNFHGIHLACVAGPNGSGKSSLLDAITWVLFGRSRTKSDDDVVNKTAGALGETAEVSLTFELEGVIYRVVRAKKVGRTAKLDLSVSSGESGWKSISESRMRETQETIIQLLRMNYETFTNASFFLQGKADTFTTNSAAHRKEILANLLGLDIWDRYKEITSERRKLEGEQMLLIEGRLDDIELELAEEPTRQATLSTALDELESATSRLQIEEQLLIERRKVEAAVEQQKKLIESIDENMASLKETAESLEALKGERSAERAAYQNLFDDAESIRASYESWKELEGQERHWRRKQNDFRELADRLKPLEIELESEKVRLEERFKELERRAAEIPELEQELVAVQAKMEVLQKNEKDTQNQLEAMNEVELRWKQLDFEIRELTESRAATQREIDILTDQQMAVSKQRLESTSLQENLSHTAAKLKRVSSELEAIDEAQRELVSLASKKESIEEEQNRLKAEMDEVKSAISTLVDSKSGSCPLCNQPLTDEHRQLVLDKLGQDGKNMGDRYRDNLQILKVIREKTIRHSTVSQKQAQTEDALLKLQNKSAEVESKLGLIKNSLKEWDKSGAPRLEALQNSLDDPHYVKLVGDAERLEAQLEPKTELENQLNQITTDQVVLQNRSQAIDQALAEWHGDGQAAGLSKNFEHIRLRLEGEDYAQETRKQFDKLKAEVEAVGYDRELHESVQHKLEELSEAPKTFQELSSAAAAVKHLDDNLADISNQLEAGQKKTAELREQLIQAENSLISLSPDGADLSVLEKDLQEMREAQIAAHRRSAAAQQKVDVLQDLQQKKERELENKEEKALLVQRLMMLEQAFSRKGVQSLLIERALPEIENDANLILDQITEGEMQVRLESQRQLKSSDRTIETLDIYISDREGLRPYENYSGGEQFRVNFAIRLALSKILTRRAGARLQTLVIDEGFGSQDPLGRQRLIEAINSIQDDFERILVITHIDEIRDAFPTQILVSREATGSTITVL